MRHRPIRLSSVTPSIGWQQRQPDSIQAIVTDPPYGLKEYSEVEKQKLRAGRGGVWRIPPSFDGCKRSPVPRFTVLDQAELSAVRAFFARFAVAAMRLLVPGGHIFIATNPLLSHLVYMPLMEAGFEKRGEIIRLVQTLRGGDRPKKRSRRICTRQRHAEIRLGTMGIVHEAVRGSSPGQSPEMEDWRPSLEYPQTNHSAT